MSYQSLESGERYLGRVSPLASILHWVCFRLVVRQLLLTGEGHTAHRALVFLPRCGHVDLTVLHEFFLGTETGAAGGALERRRPLGDRHGGHPSEDEAEYQATDEASSDHRSAYRHQGHVHARSKSVGHRKEEDYPDHDSCNRAEPEPFCYGVGPKLPDFEDQDAEDRSPMMRPVIRCISHPAAVAIEPVIPIIMTAATKKGTPLIGIIEAMPPTMRAPMNPPNRANPMVRDADAAGKSS